MRYLVLAASFVFGMAGAASAMCDVELAFSPDVAGPGDEVAFFASIANLGDEDAVATIDMTLTFMEYEFGPFSCDLPLAAGEELSRELAFIVPPLPMEGTFTITVTATCNGESDTATASLTIEPAEGDANFDGLAGIGPELIAGISGAPVADEATSFGDLKAMFR